MTPAPLSLRARRLIEACDKVFDRAPEHDRRIRRGDDFAGDAWRNRETGEVRHTVVGYDLNAHIERVTEIRPGATVPVFGDVAWDSGKRTEGE